MYLTSVGIRVLELLDPRVQMRSAVAGHAFGCGTMERGITKACGEGKRDGPGPCAGLKHEALAEFAAAPSRCLPISSGAANWNVSFRARYDDGDAEWRDGEGACREGPTEHVERAPVRNGVSRVMNRPGSRKAPILRLPTGRRCWRGKEVDEILTGPHLHTGRTF